jgi:Spy/CpxP family protein refolding chaperone
LPSARIGQAVLALALMQGGLAAADVAAQEPAAARAASADPTPRPHDRRNDALEGRVRLMAKELDLDPTQQGQVSVILQGQRNQVAALWNDTSIPAALRVNRTQLISDHTAEQIRALLNDAQREKYIKARVRDAKVGTAGASLETWQNPGKTK